MLDRRSFLGRAALGAVLLVPGRGPARGGSSIRPEDFGARGDGVTNDTDAFAALSDHVSKLGGGTVALAHRKTYLVGKQVRNSGRYFLSPRPILKFNGLRLPLRVVGNDARLVAAPGLKFGIFDETSLRPRTFPRPNYRPEGICAPYDAMIEVSDCIGAIEISGLELDGNVSGMIVGGPFGDTGHQLPGSGLILTNNRSTEIIIAVNSHHHPLDGMIINGSEHRQGRGRISRLRARFNGRQGLSVVGGKAYDLLDCDFSNTGRSKVFSAPGAGVDIEAEGKQVRDVNFLRCRFVANSGPGLLADQGNSEEITCTDCTFVGTTSWSAWPNKPSMRFAGCTFVGAIANPFASKDPLLATRFERCTFRDDPALAPGGQIFFNDVSGSGPIVDLGGNSGTNVLFSRCTFHLTHKGRLPWSQQATYADNVMSQASRETGYPRGRYLGRNIINGRVDLNSSIISGEVIVNGRRITL
jgi:hypothetical protein